ncbi:MAG: hypothetical protein AAGA84_12095 [Pseudomonadota bacterium]
MIRSSVELDALKHAYQDIRAPDGLDCDEIVVQQLASSQRNPVRLSPALAAAMSSVAIVATLVYFSKTDHTSQTRELPSMTLSTPTPTTDQSISMRLGNIKAPVHISAPKPNTTRQTTRDTDDLTTRLFRQDITDATA